MEVIKFDPKLNDGQHWAVTPVDELERKDWQVFREALRMIPEGETVEIKKDTMSEEKFNKLEDI